MELMPPASQHSASQHLVSRRWTKPSLWPAIRRGACNRCPACGQAPLFDGWLHVLDRCQSCSAPLGLVRADDAPPYFVILITGHILVPCLVLLEQFRHPPMWVLAAIFLPLTIAMTLGLLRPVKGATVGVMLRVGLLQDAEE
jgi:uncharacterized protein (DUF983 family)